MLDPTDLLDAIVGKLRLVPEIVAALDGDIDNIFAYTDQFPEQTNVRDALLTQPRPSVMVMWQASGPGMLGRNETWKHRFSLYVSPAKGTDPFALFRLIVSGVPAGGAVRLLNAQMHAAVLPMDVPTFSRGAVVMDAEGHTLDYYEVGMTLTEIGDY